MDTQIVVKKTGRPTKYNEDVHEKIKTYLKENIDSYDKDRLKVNLPTVTGFALYLGVNKDTLYEWAGKYPIFSDSLNLIVQEQEKRLINSGLSGAYNPTIAKLILSSNHGYAENTKNETDMNLSGGVILMPERNKK